MKILRAKHYGFCFGVERAYKLVEKNLEKKGKIKVWGELIHNKPALDLLRSKGMETVEDLEKVNGGLVIRSHGVSDRIKNEIQKKAEKVQDATCPFVVNVHNFVKKFLEEGRKIILIGDKEHPEMKGVTEDLNEVYCVLTGEEVASLPNLEKVGVVVQTTLKKKTFDEVSEQLKKRYKDCKIQNTICNATTERQEAVKELARQCDLVLVVGGKNSNNSKKLWEIASSFCESYKVETEDELEKEWLEGKEKVGISAGASTPHWLIDKVEEKLKELVKLGNF